MATPPKNPASPSASWSTIKTRKRPNADHVDIVLDPVVADRVDQANLAVLIAEQEAKGEETPESAAALQKARDALTAARADAKLSMVRFYFQAIPRPDYEALIDAHPPTRAQLNEAVREERPKPLYDVDTFPPALVSACSIDEPPGASSPITVAAALSPSDVDELWADPAWNGVEQGALFFCARDVCERRRVVDLGKDFGTTPS